MGVYGNLQEVTDRIWGSRLGKNKHEGPTINETIIRVSTGVKERGLCLICPHCVAVEEPLLGRYTVLGTLLALRWMDGDHFPTCPAWASS